MIPYAVERNPDKVGLNFSSIGVPIISEDEMRERQPEYLLVGPWWFRDMFARREKDYLQAGGALIFPLPEVEVITA
jgi:NDP-4-keto-2,6-dideoxyhexose 3-C-methyltransferase